MFAFSFFFLSQNQLVLNEQQQAVIEALSEERSDLLQRLQVAEEAREAEMKSRVSVETKLVALDEFKKSAEQLMVRAYPLLMLD